VRVLGTLTVETGMSTTQATPPSMLQVPGAKERTLLGRLLICPGRTVPVDVLVDDLWDGTPPPTARKSLQAHVVRLRTALEPERSKGSPGRYVIRRGDGYLLALAPDEIDAGVVGTRAASGRTALAAGDAATARAYFASALELWRGEPFADWRDAPWAAGERRRLGGVQTALLEGRIDADLALGRHRELVPELETLVAAEGLNEGWWGRLMLALYRSDRQGDALAAAREARALLVAELGVEPGPMLRRLEQDILAQAPALSLPEGAGRLAVGHRALGFGGGETGTATAGNGSDPGADAGGDDDALDSCPYRGLAAYGVADAALLHGRGSAIRGLVARTRASRLVVVSGPSGAGKSSLVRAGLLPALAGDAIPGSRRWRQVVLTPDRAPVDQLAPLLAADREPGQVCLVVDQFEEIWTSGLDAGEREAFLAALLDLLADDVAARVVVVVRGDHLGRLAETPELADAAATGLMLVPPMTEAEIREVVEGPAAATGLSVEPDLTDAVLREVSGQAGILPLLSSALVGTWERRRGRTLTLAGYLECGGVAGALASIAEKAYGALDAEGREAARPFLLRLAAEGEGGSVVRRRVPLAELGLEGEPGSVRRRVLEAFVAVRLLTIDAEHVEVTHEAVFVAWPRLVAWLAEDATGRAVRAHLAPAAAAWHVAGHPADGLYRGARLDAAQEWLARPDSDPTDEEAEFVRVSVARSQAELAEARARAERERAGRRRVRRLAMVLAATAVVALGAGVLALSRQREAQANATRADAERLAAASANAPAVDVTMLLAAQAYRTKATAQTEDALLSAAMAHRQVLGVFRQEGVRNIAISPDGGTLYGQDTSELLAWDLSAPSQEPRTVGRGLGGVAGAAAYLDVSPLRDGPDRGLVAVVASAAPGAPSTVRLVDSSGSVRWTLSEKEVGGWPLSVRFTSGGDRVVVERWMDPYGGRPTHGAVFADVRTGRVQASPVVSALPEGFIGVVDVAGTSLSPGGRSMTSSNETELSVWDVERGVRTTLDTRGRDTAAEAAYPVIGGTFAVTQAGTLYWYPVGSAGPVQQLAGHTSDILTVGTDAAGRVMVSGGTDRRVVVADRDPDTGWTTRTTLTGHRGTIVAAVVTADGSQAFSASEDGTVIQWDLGGRSGFGTWSPLLPQPTNPRGQFTIGTPVAASADGEDVWVTPTFQGSEDPRTTRVNAFVIDPATRLPLAPPLQLTPTVHPDQSFTNVQPSARPDGEQVAVPALWTTAVLDVRSRRVVRQLPSPPLPGTSTPDRVAACAWSRDGRRLFLGTGGGAEDDTGHGAVVTVDTATWRAVGRRIDLGAAVTVLRAGPDARLLAAGLASGRVVILDQRTGAVLRRLEASGPVRDLAFSPDGRALAAVGAASVLDIWDPVTGRRLLDPPQRFTGRGVSVQWLPDGRTVVYGGDDGRAVLFDLERGISRGIPMALFSDSSDGEVYVAPVSGPDLHLLSGVRPGRTPKERRSYSLDPAKWLAFACTVVRRDLSRSEWDRYLPGTPWRRTCSDLRTPAA
jgi:DNA-binding SARP family transcriptional activator/WD40 repeat protein